MKGLGGWKSKHGFQMLQNLLRCYPSEYTLWDSSLNCEMSEETWLSRSYRKGDKPELLCKEHNIVVTTTSFNNIAKGQTVGCIQCSTKLKLWSGRYDEANEKLSSMGYKLMTTRSEWIESCTSNKYKPLIQCLKHPDEMPIQSTAIAEFMAGQGVGCPRCCPNNHPNYHWIQNYERAKIELPPKGFELFMTKEEWNENCKNNKSKMPFKCLIHGTVVHSRIAHIQQGNGVACPQCGCNKTENKFEEWMNTVCIPWIISRSKVKTVSYVRNNIRGPQTEKRYYTWYDGKLVFDNGFHCIIEIDGEQHFNNNHRYFNEDMCQNDLLKENHALHIEKVSLIRVLQKDVWKDKNDWEAYMQISIRKAHNRWAKGKRPRVYLPPGNRWEYTNPNHSVYAQLRMTSALDKVTHVS